MFDFRKKYIIFELGIKVLIIFVMLNENNKKSFGVRTEILALA